MYVLLILYFIVLIRFSHRKRCAAVELKRENLSVKGICLDHKQILHFIKRNTCFLYKCASHSELPSHITTNMAFFQTHHPARPESGGAQCSPLSKLRRCPPPLRQARCCQLEIFRGFFINISRILAYLHFVADSYNFAWMVVQNIMLTCVEKRGIFSAEWICLYRQQSLNLKN